ncbi:CotD family spore coat protein [Heyndrickxia ginsengihumi]
MSHFKHHHHLGGHCGAKECPPMVAPTQYDPGMTDPAQNSVQTTIFPHVVNHVHPTHTTHVNKHVYTHKHYFPHTDSVVNECYENHVFCGAPVNPCCPPHHRPRPFGF